MTDKKEIKPVQQMDGFFISTQSIFCLLPIRKKCGIITDNQKFIETDRNK
jgi:hypothetical protein